jgi:pyruvate formate lyase activating enzyme
LNEELVDFVSMDIKSSKEKYNEITETQVDISKIEESIKLISKMQEYEFRTTVLRDIHNKEEIKKIALWLNELIGRKPKTFVLQAFKNKGKILSKMFENEKDVSDEELEPLREEIKDFFENVEVRG